MASDIGIAGDWNGDGFDEIGIYRGNQFWLDANGNGVWDGVAGGDRFHTFRNVGDKPLVGDWDGDGDDDLGTWNGGFFHLDLNGNGVWDGAAAGDVRIHVRTDNRHTAGGRLGWRWRRRDRCATRLHVSTWMPMAMESGMAS